MQLVIASPLYPPEIGGPAVYAKELKERFTRAGHSVSLVIFSDLRRYPAFLRHLFYFFRVYTAARRADAVLMFDTWSTGLPALCAAKSRGVKTIVRIGGDVLWESYVERTRELVKLSAFYTATRPLSVKERLMKRGTQWILDHADAIAFTTTWQQHIWEKAYATVAAKARVIENAYPSERVPSPATSRTFVAAGRDRVLKNMTLLRSVIAELQQKHPDVSLDTRTLPPREHEARVQDAYAVLIPSVSEVNPNTAIEALQYGKPFVMSLDTGARERLAEIGLFVDTLDHAAVRAGIETLLDPEEYQSRVDRIRTYSFSHSWDEVAREFLSLIEKLCAS